LLALDFRSALDRQPALGQYERMFNRSRMAHWIAWWRRLLLMQRHRG